MNTIVEYRSDELTLQQLHQQNFPGTSIPWIVNLRDSAFNQFKISGMPNPQMEDWKYTNFKSLQRQAFSFPNKRNLKINESEISSALIPNLDVYRVVFVDGALDENLSQLDKIPSEIHLASIADQLQNNNDEVKSFLGKYANTEKNGFVLLNTALMQDGIYIHLLKNCVVEKPIHLIYISTTQTHPTWFHLRNLIIAEENSQASIIESYIGFGDSVYFNNVTTEIVLAKRAKLSHYKIQQEAKLSFHISLSKVHQQQDSLFSSYLFALGGRLARNEIRSDLSEPRCEYVAKGLYFASEHQQLDTFARVDHLAENCTSRVFFKGIANDQARAVFRGIAYVHPDAQRSDAEQKNNNLLLSPDAEVDTKPQLEIYANDVKCSHGATVGQLDDDALFYLCSRGIKEQIARSLLTYSFAKEITDSLPIKPIAQYIEQHLKNILPGAKSLGNLE